MKNNFSTQRYRVEDMRKYKMESHGFDTIHKYINEKKLLGNDDECHNDDEDEDNESMYKNKAYESDDQFKRKSAANK